MEYSVREFGVFTEPEKNYGVIVSVARNVHADGRNRRMIVRHTLHGLLNGERRYELIACLIRKFTSYADSKEVGVVAILLSPRFDLPLVGDRHVSGVHVPRVPCRTLLAVIESRIESPGSSRRVSEHKHERFPVG